jgi:hypothetical protein
LSGGGPPGLQQSRAKSALAVNATSPNIKWHITLLAPRTRTHRPPYRSFNKLFTRSLAWISTERN